MPRGRVVRMSGGDAVYSELRRRILSLNLELAPGFDSRKRS